MKRTDIAMIIFIASMSVLVSYFVAKSVLGDVQNEAVMVKTADPIVSEVDKPDERIFNKDSVNPTVEVSIGEEGRS